MTGEDPRRVAVVGLGYVGLPLAVAAARRHPGTLGFDIDERKVDRLRAGRDTTGAVEPEELAECDLELTSDPAALESAQLFIVTVPTPIDSHRRPDLRALQSATRTVGAALGRGSIVVYESTVYPGATEEVCAPILEEASGLVCGKDFTLGYSPERINPGDREHTFSNVCKIVAGQDEVTRNALVDFYGSIVDAGIHAAPTLRVAEAAKVIENVQRDLNIALMNELAIIFDRLDIPTAAVLDAAATKWNFHRYHPGLVGGHCIGVDPYYLTAKAEAAGIHPQVILAGRRINDGMGSFVAAKTVKLLVAAKRQIHGARIGVLGMAFKAGVSDHRNSRVPDIVRELKDYRADVAVHDPCVDAEEVLTEYGLELAGETLLDDLDALILATPHPELVTLAKRLVDRPDGPAVVVDVLSALDRTELRDDVDYWCL